MAEALSHSRYAHLATHGFFSAPDVKNLFDVDLRETSLFETMSGHRSATVAGRNPLLLSGLVVTGANLPPEKDTLGIPTGEDGVLTAEEIAGLDLRNTELVTLSACETGLGDVAAGEGVFGLQRAFHQAGARSVIASLWKVDDAATQALMVEFYQNLWQKKLGKLHALRSATEDDPPLRRQVGRSPRPGKQANQTHRRRPKAKQTTALLLVRLPTQRRLALILPGAGETRARPPFAVKWKKLSQILTERLHFPGTPRPSAASKGRGESIR